MGFLGGILFMILFVILFFGMIGLSLLVRLFGGLRNLWNVLTGVRQAQKSTQSAHTYNKGTRESRSSASSRSANQGNRPHSNSHVFSDDEGTYVDFEEIK